eukprot:1390166-Pleurochrysis_carterae.AAC.2
MSMSNTGHSNQPVLSTGYLPSRRQQLPMTYMKYNHRLVRYTRSSRNLTVQPSAYTLQQSQKSQSQPYPH